MLELSLHVLDIAENSTRACAKVIRITVIENEGPDRLIIEIEDDGNGMDQETLRRALDPFFTSKKVRRVGLGLPMLAEAARRTGGRFEIESKPGKGTRVVAEFGYSHVDRQPLGDITGTLINLIVGHPGVDFVYTHSKNGLDFVLDTRDIKKELDNVPINHIEVLKYIREHVKGGLKEISADV
jgi:signal transduction histidine kinase